MIASSVSHSQGLGVVPELCPEVVPRFIRPAEKPVRGLNGLMCGFFAFEPWWHFYLAQWDCFRKFPTVESSLGQMKVQWSLSKSVVCQEITKTMDYVVQPWDMEIFKRWMIHIINTGCKTWGLASENREEGLSFSFLFLFIISFFLGKRIPFIFSDDDLACIHSISVKARKGCLLLWNWSFGSCKLLCGCP